MKFDPTDWDDDASALMGAMERLERVEAERNHLEGLVALWIGFHEELDRAANLTELLHESARALGHSD